MRCRDLRDIQLVELGGETVSQLLQTVGVIFRRRLNLILDRSDSLHQLLDDFNPLVHVLLQADIKIRLERRCWTMRWARPGSASSADTDTTSTSDTAAGRHLRLKPQSGFGHIVDQLRLDQGHLVGSQTIGEL